MAISYELQEIQDKCCIKTAETLQKPHSGLPTLGRN